MLTTPIWDLALLMMCIQLMQISPPLVATSLHLLRESIPPPFATLLTQDLYLSVFLIVLTASTLMGPMPL